MNANELKAVCKAAPFQPFEIVLTNATRVPINHPEFMSFSHDYRKVYVSRLSGGVERIDIKMVIALDDLMNDSRPPKRKRKR